MRRIHWTLDLQEAEIVAGLLRAEGVEAFVFDAGIVRANWNMALAYGGYRVMVAQNHLAQGRQVLAAWWQGEYALPDAMDDAPTCPRCGGSGIHPDQRRRGWTFVLFVMLCLPMPWRWQRRVQCDHCGKRWNRAPSEDSHHDLAR